MVSFNFLRTGVLAVFASKILLPHVHAAVSDIPLDPIGGGLTNDNMDTIMRMVSIAENANTEWWTYYNDCEDIADGRGYTVSLVGFTSATGDLLEVFRDIKSLNATHPLVKFLPALEEANGSATHKGLTDLCSMIQSHADDTWKKAVWQGIKTEYLFGALGWAANKNLTSVFSKGFLFYVTLRYGLDEINKYVSTSVKPPSEGGSEVAYMQAYVQAVLQYINVHIGPGDYIVPDDVFMWKSVLDKNNLSLRRPLFLTCYGESFTIA